MTPSNLHRDHFIEIAYQLVDRLPDTDLCAAFLFGSVAWSDADAASDLDVMLLLNRPAEYREVTRVRLADVLGRSLPDGPAFADLDRIAVTTFQAEVDAGRWVYRVVHSVILHDTDNLYAGLRAQVSALYSQPAARAARFRERAAMAETERTAMRQAIAGDDVLLAALHARLAVQEAGGALIELNDDRASPGHFVDSLERALARFGRGDLIAAVHAALALDDSLNRVEQSLRSYDAFAGALKAWVADPAVGGNLSPEDLAWASFTYEAQTYEEINHKVDGFTRRGRLSALLFYLDGLLLVPVRMNVSKVLLLQATGASGIMPIPEFHVALHEHPVLYDAWVTALRLSPEQDRAREADSIAVELLAIGTSWTP